MEVNYNHSLQNLFHETSQNLEAGRPNPTKYVFDVHLLKQTAKECEQIRIVLPQSRHLDRFCSVENQNILKYEYK